MKAPKQWLLRAYCQLLCIGTLKLIVISSFWRWGNRASEMWGHLPRSHSDTDWIFASLQNSYFEALIHSVMVISRFGLWKVIRFGWSIKDGISVLIKERDQNTHTHTHTHTLSLSLFLSLLHVMTQWEGGHLQTWKRALSGTEPASTLILNFPVSKTVWNNCQSLGHPACGCDSRQSWLRSVVNNYFWAPRFVPRSAVASGHDLAILQPSLFLSELFVWVQ